MTDKLTPGECIVEDDGQVCNDDGDIVRKDIEDLSSSKFEDVTGDMELEGRPRSFGDVFASVWNGLP